MVDVFCVGLVHCQEHDCEMKNLAHDWIRPHDPQIGKERSYPLVTEYSFNPCDWIYSDLFKAWLILRFKNLSRFQRQKSFQPKGSLHEAKNQIKIVQTWVSEKIRLIKESRIMKVMILTLARAFCCTPSLSHSVDLLEERRFSNPHISW